jgi:nucleotide-binding universal stress UspA family protein
VHIRETAVVDEQAVDAEYADQARSAVLAHLGRLAERGVRATGQVLTSVGDHSAAGRVLTEHAEEVSARIIAVGRSPRGAVAQFADGSFTAALARTAPCTVMLVRPGRAPHPLTPATLDELRSRSA